MPLIVGLEQLYNIPLLFGNNLCLFIDQKMLSVRARLKVKLKNNITELMQLSEIN